MTLIERAARMAHEINRAYCISIGDNSQPIWDKAPDWQKQSAMKGVEMVLKDPFVTPEKLHQSWCDEKIKDGWVVGPVKDQEKKEHPCLVDYDQLPQSQRTKDYLFRTSVMGVISDHQDYAIEMQSVLRGDRLSKEGT